MVMDSSKEQLLASFITSVDRLAHVWIKMSPILCGWMLRKVLFVKWSKVLDVRWFTLVLQNDYGMIVSKEKP
jgi:hypothetical protein